MDAFHTTITLVDRWVHLIDSICEANILASQVCLYGLY